MRKKFLRRDAKRFKKFGKGKGKKAKWRKPTGRDNKMREKRRGYPPVVGIGERKMKKGRGKSEGKTPVIISAPNDLSKMKKNEIGIVGNVGRKKKIEIAKKSEQMKIRLKNLNSKSFLKKIDKETKKEKKPEKEEPKKTEEKEEVSKK